MPKAQNRYPVMVVFDLHLVENKIALFDMQKVSSAYTKGKRPTSTIDFIKSSLILYSDKEKTTSLLHSVDFQNVYSVERSGRVGSITYEGPKVNISGKTFSEVFANSVSRSQRRETDDVTVRGSELSQT